MLANHVRSVAATPTEAAMGTNERGRHSKTRNLDTEEQCREWRPEHGSHAAGRTGDEEGASLPRRQFEELGEHGTDSATGEDDRPLGAKGPTRADADRARKRLQEDKTRLGLAAPDQNRLHRLGNAVAADPLRSETGHQADQQPSHDRDQDGPDAEMLQRRRHETPAEIPVVREMRKKADQRQQREGDPGR
jgi:hypothetical protein